MAWILWLGRIEVITPILKPKEQRPKQRGAVTIYPDGREKCRNVPSGKREYERRKMQMRERQGFTCALMLDDACKREIGYLHESNTTFDHEAGRGLGGGHRDDSLLKPDGSWRNAAVCVACNGLKGSRRYQWVDNREYLPVAS